MQINDIFTDLHGNQYEIMDFHVLGPDYPLFQDNRDAILTSSTQDEHINLIIRGMINLSYIMNIIKYIGCMTSSLFNISINLT